MEYGDFPLHDEHLLAAGKPVPARMHGRYLRCPDQTCRGDLFFVPLEKERPTLVSVKEGDMLHCYVCESDYFVLGKTEDSIRWPILQRM